MTHTHTHTALLCAGQRATRCRWRTGDRRVEEGKQREVKWRRRCCYSLQLFVKKKEERKINK